MEPSGSSNTREESSEKLDTKYFISGFKDLTPGEIKPLVFRELESELANAGFELANANEVASILNNNSLMCRSEDIERVFGLITEQNDIDVLNRELQANICKMSSTEGFRTAMTEGFGNRSVDGKVKVVISFRPNHIENYGGVPKDDALWKLKPIVASVSVVGRGQITSEDVEMISFRFPTHLYPEQMLTEHEMDMLEESGLPFIVRHYVSTKKAVH